MATLAERTTSGESSWDVYVKKNPRWNIIQFQIKKGEMNVPVYKQVFDIPQTPQQARTKQPFYTVNQDNTVMIKENDFRVVGRSRYAKISYKQKVGYININKIRKPTGAGDDVEKRYLNLIQENIEQLKRYASSGTIDVTIDGLPPIFGIDKIDKVSNRIHGREAKSDFVFKDKRGKSLLHISHKAGESPTAFGQYGGVSEVAGNIQDASLIYQDPEVQSYLTRLYELYSDAIGDREIENNPFSSGGTLDKGVYRNINSPTLINRSIFGPDYGGQRGPDNVDLIAQGHFVFDPIISPYGDVTYKLSFTGDHEVNGNITKFVDNTSGYRAVLMTTKRGGRPTQTPSGTVPETRTAIYPRYYRGSAINIDTLLP
jgi:hypothetical protein